MYINIRAFVSISHKYNMCNVINTFNSVLRMNRISYVLVVWLIILVNYKFNRIS